MSGPGILHETIVGMIPGAETKGFRQAVDRLLYRLTGDEEETIGNLSVVPDAFREYEDEDGDPAIDVYEVAITSPLTEKRILAFGEIWGWIDDITDRFTLRLFEIDNGGNAREVSLQLAYYAALRSAMGPTTPERRAEAIEFFGGAEECERRFGITA